MGLNVDKQGYGLIEYGAVGKIDGNKHQLLFKDSIIKSINSDEFDTKERRVFNYGHSFGHAIEALTNYKVPHGIAVSYGMDMANFVSVKLGYINEDLRMHIRELLQQVWEGTNITNIDLDDFKKALSKDKKNVGKELRLILNKGLGNIFQDKMQMDERFTGWLKEYFETQL